MDPPWAVLGESGDDSLCAEESEDWGGELPKDRRQPPPHISAPLDQSAARIIATGLGGGG
jgi:hypothetical protein